MPYDDRIFDGRLSLRSWPGPMKLKSEMRPAVEVELGRIKKGELMRAAADEIAQMIRSTEGAIPREIDVGNITRLDRRVPTKRRRLIRRG
jgi:hypothetical protein